VADNTIEGPPVRTYWVYGVTKSAKLAILEIKSWTLQGDEDGLVESQVYASEPASNLPSNLGQLSIKQFWAMVNQGLLQQMGKHPGALDLESFLLGENDAMLQHLAECPECRHAVEQLQALAAIPVKEN
jgi:hypothetical protein